MCWQNDLGSRLALPLSERIVASPKIVALQANAILDLGCEEGADWVWRRIDATAPASGVSLETLAGSVLVNAGCGRRNLASSIEFAYRHKVQAYIMNDILLPPDEKIRMIMESTDRKIRSRMGIVFAEGDMAELLGLLSGNANVVMNLISGPEIITDAGKKQNFESYMAAIATRLTSLVAPGGIFFGHSSAPSRYLPRGDWVSKTDGSVLYCVRK